MYYALPLFFLDFSALYQWVIWVFVHVKAHLCSTLRVHMNTD